MEYDADSTHAMRCGMLGDAGSRRAHRIVGHDMGTLAPALINILVYVAVVACKITSAMDLEYVLANRVRRHAHPHGGVRWSS
ncbi:hypothetical protein GCM10009681_03420 [Luedemannella helvata]|uniref:Uncharacterized protein n=1 Tax=Luedemannella helvata TaxID=349315 RepID=A0ABN2JT63_9ACTN